MLANSFIRMLVAAAITLQTTQAYANTGAVVRSALKIESKVMPRRLPTPKSRQTAASRTSKTASKAVSVLSMLQTSDGAKPVIMIGGRRKIPTKPTVSSRAPSKKR
jgi:hypothetical protein